MCRGVVAVVLGVGVWARDVSVMTNVADNIERMIKDRFIELFDARMGSSCSAAL
jgi:hypothetical protein